MTRVFMPQGFTVQETNIPAIQGKVQIPTSAAFVPL